MFRSVRIFPHHQDTGGFFIAVLRKIGSITKLDQKLNAGIWLLAILSCRVGVGGGGAVYLKKKKNLSVRGFLEMFRLKRFSLFRIPRFHLLKRN